MIELRRALACALILAVALAAPLQSFAAPAPTGGFESWWKSLSPVTRDVLVLGGVLGAAGVWAVLAGNPATLPLAAMILKGAGGFAAGAATGALIALVKNAFSGGGAPAASAMGGGGPSLLGVQSR
jgi:hypothetical protein